MRRTCGRKRSLGVVGAWEFYRGQRIGAEEVRAWLNQVATHTEQRILFRLLENLRFVGEAEAGEMLLRAHEWLREKLPIFVKKRRAARRDDVLVTYVDGPGKSGAYYASLYAKMNDIRALNVVIPDAIGEKCRATLRGGELGVVVVDDIIATGRNLVESIGRVADSPDGAGIGAAIPLSVVVLCGTVEGERRVREYLEKSTTNADLVVCEMLEERHFAFGGSVGFWRPRRKGTRRRLWSWTLGRRYRSVLPWATASKGCWLRSRGTAQTTVFLYCMEGAKDGIHGTTVSEI